MDWFWSNLSDFSIFIKMVSKGSGPLCEGFCYKVNLTVYCILYVKTWKIFLLLRFYVKSFWLLQNLTNVDFLTISGECVQKFTSWNPKLSTSDFVIVYCIILSGQNHSFVKQNTNFFTIWISEYFSRFFFSNSYFSKPGRCKIMKNVTLE